MDLGDVARPSKREVRRARRLFNGNIKRYGKLPEKNILVDLAPLGSGPVLFLSVAVEAADGLTP